MFYLIDKRDGHIVNEAASKGKLRRIQRLSEDKEFLKVSKNGQTTIDSAIKTKKLSKSEEKRIAIQKKSKTKVEKPKGNLTKYEDQTPLMLTKEAVERYCIKRKYSTFKIEKHASGQFFAFFDN